MRGGEAVDQSGGDGRRTAQRFDHRDQTVAEAGLAQIAEPGAQQHDRCRGQPRLDDQAVEGVIFRARFEHGSNRALDRRDIALQRVAAGQFDLEIMDEGVGIAGQRGRQLLNHAKAEILEHRHRVGQRQRPAQAVELDPQLAVMVIDADRARLGIAQPGNAHDVARRFLRRVAVAIAEREGRGVAQRQPRRARRRRAIVAQCDFDRGQPAAHHPLQFKVERGGIGHPPFSAQVERVAQQCDRPVLQRNRPVEQRGMCRARQHLANRHAPTGRHVIARQPDKGEEMAAQRAADHYQFRARAIGYRHGGERDLLQRFGREGGGQVVRQAGQGMRQRLASMAARVEAELAFKAGDACAQHRHFVGRGMQRGAGPQAGMDRQAGDMRHAVIALGTQRHQYQIERCATVHGRHEIGLEQQRRLAALFEPFDRRLARAFGEQRRVEVHAANARRVGHAAVAMPVFMSHQRHAAALEPAQQRGAFGIGDPVRIVAHRAAQFAPVGHCGANMAQIAFKIADQPASVARIGTFKLQIDHRFA